VSDVEGVWKGSRRGGVRRKVKTSLKAYEDLMK
jgi:hypothetical protein